MSKFEWQVEATCVNFVNIAHLLHLIPCTAENAFGIDYELRPTTSASENHKFVTVIKVGPSSTCMLYIVLIYMLHYNSLQSRV